MLNESGSSYMDEIVYYDGLGRPFQTVQKGITPSPCSISLQEYDEVGRKGKAGYRESCIPLYGFC